MPRLVWLDSPEELRRIVEPYLARELPILPTLGATAEPLVFHNGPEVGEM